MDMLSAILHRRSIRQYTIDPVSEDNLKKIMYAGLASASSKNRKSWEFILVQKRDTLDKLSACRPGAANLLEGCSAAIVVVGDTKLTDVWVEDCASAITQMHLMADSLGIGSCWLQIRLRKAMDGVTDSQDVVREILEIPARFGVMAILVLGTPAVHPGERDISDLSCEKIHYEQF